MRVPEQIFDLLIGYRIAAALRAAIELGVFTAIAKGDRTAAAVAQRVKASERGVRILLDALVSTRLLLTKKRMEYDLTPLARQYLVRGSEDYVGGMLRLSGYHIMWNAFGTLTEAVRKGTSVVEKDAHSENQEFWEFFARSTPVDAARAAKALVSHLGVTKKSGPMKVLDVACGSGMYGLAVAKVNPKAKVTLQDQANVIPHTRRNVAKSKAASRVQFLEGDAFEVDFGGPYDAVILSQVLHHFDEEENVRLLRKVRKAMKSGGRLIVQEFITDDARSRRRRQLLFALTMLVFTRAGDAYSFGEVRRMLVNSGFRHILFHDVTQATQFATALK